MDGPRDYHIKRGKLEDRYYMIPLICGILKSGTNKLIYKTKIDFCYRKQTSV